MPDRFAPPRRRPPPPRGLAPRALSRTPRLLSALLLSLLATAALAEERVRIGVASGLALVQVSGPGLAATALRDGAAARPSAGERAEVRLVGDELLLDGAPLDGAGVTFTAGGPIRCAGRLLSGEVEVRRAAGGLAVIDALPLEDYVAAVAGAEMPPAFPLEALKAQAVAARSYALSRKLEAVEEGRDYDLGATVLSQVYPGQAVDPRARAAAAATAGEVLVKDRRPAEAYFHSTCGGRTERGLDALGRDLDYLVSVECGRCGASPKATWRLRLRADELALLADLPGRASGLLVIERTRAGRASRVEVRAGKSRTRLTAVDLRQRLGYERLPSLWFSVKATGGAFVLTGRGSGHGGGLCQWGAAGWARAGADHREILRRYYPGTEIVKMY
ncbi:MAG TPA: SpoIID/LytB domain-containing protein [Anaeromyxobacteraceae bacterium]|nr:SpoIID/LytB domain-containing protein [Anaeromyxobacteraceae bacterium]